MQTVVETPAYLAKAEPLLSETERADIITAVAKDPEAGVLIRGSGGVRKLRHGRQSRGKSGGVRVVYFYHDERLPLFLLAVFAKNERANLSRAEINQLAGICRLIRASYGVNR